MGKVSFEIPTSMRASVLSPKLTLSVEERTVPTPDADQVLVKVMAVGVCGSDVHFYHEGRIGDMIVESPICLGHEMSGQIVAVGSAVDSSRIGQRVAVEPQRPCRTCDQCFAGRYNLCRNIEFYAAPPIDGAFCEYVTIQHNFAFEMPEDMSYEAGALLEPLSVAIAAMRKGKVVPGSRVLIAGAGPIGVICAQTAKAYGASEIIVTDLVESRRQKALTYGATSVLDPRVDDTRQLGVDCFIDATGAAPAVMAGVLATGPNGIAVIVGMGADEMLLPISHIQAKEISVTGIFRYTDSWPTAIHLVSSGLVELDSLVTGKFTIDEVQEAFETDKNPDSLKSVVYPNGIF